MSRTNPHYNSRCGSEAAREDGWCIEHKYSYKTTTFTVETVISGSFLCTSGASFGACPQLAVLVVFVLLTVAVRAQDGGDVGQLRGPVAQTAVTEPLHGTWNRGQVLAVKLKTQCIELQVILAMIKCNIRHWTMFASTLILVLHV